MIFYASLFVILGFTFFFSSTIGAPYCDDLVACLIAPCSQPKSPELNSCLSQYTNPSPMCIDNYCGGCNRDYYVNGKEVCDPPITCLKYFGGGGSISRMIRWISYVEYKNTPTPPEYMSCPGIPRLTFYPGVCYGGPSIFPHGFSFYDLATFKDIPNCNSVQLLTDVSNQQIHIAAYSDPNCGQLVKIQNWHLGLNVDATCLGGTTLTKCLQTSGCTAQSPPANRQSYQLWYSLNCHHAPPTVPPPGHPPFSFVGQEEL